LYATFLFVFFFSVLIRSRTPKYLFSLIPVYPQKKNMNRVATKLFSQFKNVRQFSTKMEDSSLLVSQNNKLLIMELNRPKALNALNLPMIHDMRKVLNERVNSADTDVLLMKGAGGKAFCAGGDVKTLFSSVMAETGKFEATPGKAHVDFFRYEYNLDFALAVSPKPQISIWNGIVMGGGVGISVLGEFRVATEKTVFAMPECVIGLFPDVGGSAWLPHLSDGYGNYIGEFFYNFSLFLLYSIPPFFLSFFLL
jgi:3-hydroxyisobutyryl-CoA hydrolase